MFCVFFCLFFFFSSRRRHTRYWRDWSSDVCSSDLASAAPMRDVTAMTKAPLAAYPALRLRRLRQADWVRRLVRETVLTPSDLIWSMVVHEGEGEIPVASMPGVSRLSVKGCAAAAKQAKALGIPAIAVFPHIDGAKKDAA